MAEVYFVREGPASDAVVSSKEVSAVALKALIGGRTIGLASTSSPTFPSSRPAMTGFRGAQFVVIRATADDECKTLGVQPGAYHLVDGLRPEAFAD